MAGPILEISAQFPPILAPLFEPHRYKVLFGGRGGMKCLALGTRVIMFDGTLQRVENIAVGDLVMGPDSLPRTVLACSCGRDQMFEIRQTSGMTYRVNSTHMLSLKKSENCKNDRGEICSFTYDGLPNYRRPSGRYPNWPDITNINVKDVAKQSERWRAHFRGYRAGLLQFDFIENKIDPYFLGLWLGDGTSRELRLTAMDKEIINFCREYAETFGIEISCKQKLGQQAFDIGFPAEGLHENPLWAQFKQEGLANDKHIPSSYITTAEECRLQLLAGLIDTDGTLHHNGYMISQVNTELAHNIKYLADTLGFRTSITQRNTKCNKVIGKTWWISIYGNAWRIPCKLPRKQLHKEDVNPNKDFLLSQISIIPCGEGEYAGFELDGDHLFLLEDGTVTHNSWSIARAIVLRMVQEPTRVLCVREQMNSIRDSVHKLLADQIEMLGLGSLFEIQQAVIKCIAGPGAGSEASFEGIRHNISKIKSYEGINICWAEEAVNVSKTSWQVLIPTIREAGSEIWISFNPELETDETYIRFVLNPPPNAWVQEVNYYDNPWFPAELKADMEQLKHTDYDTYLHTYEGKCKVVLEGAVYADELRAASASGRICRVPYDPTVGVHTVWDLGWSDATAIWCVQRVAFETRYINYRESTRTTIEDDLKWCQQQGYTFDTFWLPHDAKAKSKGTGRSIEEIVRAKGFKTRIVPKLSLVDGINAGRTLFTNCYFDKEACADGIQALRHYRYELVEDPVRKTFTKEPVHDWTSHAADAFRYSAIAVRQPAGNLGRVSAALLAASKAEDDIFARLSRYSAGGSSTGWMR